jgi:hypothetical protein
MRRRSRPIQLTALCDGQLTLGRDGLDFVAATLEPLLVVGFAAAATSRDGFVREAMRRVGTAAFFIARRRFQVHFWLQKSRFGEARCARTITLISVGLVHGVF